MKLLKKSLNQIKAPSLRPNSVFLISRSSMGRGYCVLQFMEMGPYGTHEPADHCVALASSETPSGKTSMQAPGFFFKGGFAIHKACGGRPQFLTKHGNGHGHPKSAKFSYFTLETEKKISEGVFFLGSPGSPSSGLIFS